MNTVIEVSDTETSYRYVPRDRHEEIIAGAFLAQYAKSTRSGYAISLRQFFNFCYDIEIEPLKVKRAHIDLYHRFLAEDKGMKPQTICAKLNAICGFYRYCDQEDILLDNPAAYVKRPKIPFVSTTNGLSRSEFASMLVAAQEHSPRANAVICLLGLNGLRVGELLAAEIEHLGHERGFKTLHIPHRKGGGIATISMANRTVWAVEQYVGDRQTGPIFLDPTGEYRMSQGAARRMVSGLTKKVGIQKRISPHSLRHTFVSLSLDAGVTERDIMASTGHTCPEMVQYYDRHRGSIERNGTHALAAFVGAAI